MLPGERRKSQTNSAPDDAGVHDDAIARDEKTVAGRKQDVATIIDERSRSAVFLKERP